MLDFVTILLRIAGSGLLLLAVLHVPIGRHLGWREDCGRLTPVNASIFRVHTFFICLVLVLMGLPCVIDPAVFLTPTAAGRWLCWSFAGFWGMRLYFQYIQAAMMNDLDIPSPDAPNSKRRMNMRKIHRWVGLPAAIFLVVTSITGVWLERVKFFGAEEAERERGAL